MYNEPDLRQLRTFVAVAEELHFTRAAERMNVGQQGLSAQISRLEERLGVELLRRTTRRVELTDAGQVLLSHVRPLLASATKAWDEVRLAGSGEAGTLLVGYSPTARNEILPAVLAEIGRRHPGLEVRTSENWGGSDAILRGAADIAFIRFDVPAEDHIHGTLVKESRVGLVISAADTRARGEQISFAEMGDRVLEVPARRHSPRFHDALLELLRHHGFDGEIREYHNLTSRFMLDDQDACERIVAGESYSFGFEDQYPDLPGDLVWIPLAPSLYAPMHLCWRGAMTPTMSRFIAVTLDLSERQEWVRPEVRPIR